MNEFSANFMGDAALFAPRLTKEICRLAVEAAVEAERRCPGSGYEAGCGVIDAAWGSLVLAGLWARMDYPEASANYLSAAYEAAVRRAARYLERLQPR